MADDIFAQAFRVEALSIDRLLADWRWLCPGAYTLIARNAFGDLFLINSDGKVIWLQVAIGQITEIADSKSQFLDLLEHNSNREIWLAENDAKCASEMGLKPGLTQCIGFKIPVVFSESGDAPDNAYVADLYEQVSFLGDLHRQITNAPDGTKIRPRTSQ